MTQGNGDGCLGCAKGVILLFLLPFIVGIAEVITNVASGVGIFASVLMQVLMFLVVAVVLLGVGFGSYFLFLQLADYRHELKTRQKQRELMELPSSTQNDANQLTSNPQNPIITPLPKSNRFTPKGFGKHKGYEEWKADLEDVEKQKDDDFEG